MVHDTLPVIKTKSYLSEPSLPYFRFPALQSIERNDIVVFNWPADTLFHMYKAADKRYDKPIDKKTNYVKRCTAIPGDKIEIKDGIIFINGKESMLPERAKPQYMHKIYSKNGVATTTLLENESTEFSRKFITTIYNQNQVDALSPYVRGSFQNNDGTVTVLTDPKGIPNSVISNNNLSITEVNDFEREANFTLENAEKLRKKSIVDSIVRIINKDVEKTIFPGTKDWNVDNLGPIYIPQAGKTVELNKETLPFYKKVISEYEGKDLKVNGNEIRIDGKVATSYTFEQDYYWMMGDNRHNSLDSRYWGFVPADHIVGKPIFIWMSIDGINDGVKNWSIRWDRLFTTVSGTGQPQSYFKYFLFALAGYFAFDYFRNKKKKKEINN